MSTIPASQLVNVTPEVLAAGGNSLSMTGVVLTENARVPVNPLGSLIAFPTLLSVQNYFGAGSDEADIAAIYFNGFNRSNVKPAFISFTQYPASAVAAYLRGGAFGLTIAQMQALTGSLTAVIDGYSHVISSISLSSYSSYSAAAAGIQAAFTDPTEASFTGSLGATFTGSQSGTNLTTTAVTGLISIGDAITGTGVAADTTIVSQTSGTPGGAGVYVTSLSGTASGASCSAASTVLDVTVDTDHEIAVGQTLVGSGVSGAPLITAQLGGTAGGVGTYRISGAAQSVASESMTAAATAPLVTYDSVSDAFQITSGITGNPSAAAFATGTISAALKLTSATGAILSQGAAATDPASFMTAVVNGSTNWASFMTAFDPDGGSGNAIKLEFVQWSDGAGEKYVYSCWDPDLAPGTTVPASSSLGHRIQQGAYAGTELVYSPDYKKAAFFCGAVASIDWNQRDGRITFAYKGQDGLVPDVTDPTTASNLIANGYNFYGAYATAAQQFQLYQPGSISGAWTWADTYINQIYFNAQFQLALMLLMQQVRSIPYVIQGYRTVAGAVQGVIDQGLNFGAWRRGVPLSSLQAQEVNTAAGIAIDGILSTQGWYLQILPATAEVRQARGSPPCTFWYMDGGSVQKINLASVAVQ